MKIFQWMTTTGLQGSTDLCLSLRQHNQTLAALYSVSTGDIRGQNGQKLKMTDQYRSIPSLWVGGAVPRVWYLFGQGDFPFYGLLLLFHADITRSYSKIVAVNSVYIKCAIGTRQTKKIRICHHHHHHHYHHHVPEGLGVLSCSLILKMKLVPPPLPWSSRVLSSFWSIL